MPTVRERDDDAVARAAAALRAGHTVVLPTETVYGVAALPTVPGATAALFALKGRPDAVPLAVLAADLDQVRPWLGEVPAAALVLAERFWPGPLTLVLERNPAAAALELGGLATTVGVRCADHSFVQALVSTVGPVATTSANRHGDPTPHTAAAAAASLTGAVALVVDGGWRDGKPSTVVDLTGDVPRVLRDGALPGDEVLRVAASTRRRR